MTGMIAVEAARLLVGARRTGQTLANLPQHLRAQTQSDAHRIQDAILAELGPVGAWKIAASDDPAPFLSPLPASYVFGPDRVHPAGQLPIVLVELELAVILGQDLGPRDSPYRADDVKPAIASVHPALELITFSWTDRDQVDRLTQLADLQNSAGLVLGAAAANWADLDPATATVRLLLDGMEVASHGTGASYGQILNTIALLANHAVERGLPLEASQVITTGARLVVPVAATKSIRGEIDGFGAVWTTLT